MLNKDFREFLELLNEHDVRYLVVGGYAVAFHGHPRYTKDLDVWVEPDLANAERVVDALTKFGFESLVLKAEDFLDPEDVIQLGNPPNRIDILLALTGIRFDECYMQRVDETIDGIQVHFIDLESLRRNKRAVGRAQDIADLENLE